MGLQPPPNLMSVVSWGESEKQTNLLLYRRTTFERNTEILEYVTHRIHSIVTLQLYA